MTSASSQVRAAVHCCVQTANTWCQHQQTAAGNPLSGHFCLTVLSKALFPASADGSQLVAGVGARVLIYDASDGELLHVLKGHKVTCSW